MGKIFDRMIAAARARSAGGGLLLWLVERLCQIHQEEGWEEGRGGGGEATTVGRVGKEQQGWETNDGERDELQLALRPGWLVWGQGHRGRGRLP